MDVRITRATKDLEFKLLSLYREAATVPDGLIRIEQEITEDYIADFLDKALSNGLSLVAHVENTLVGEIHAYTPNIYAFQHLLTDLTIVVHTSYQGKGIGRKLFETFLDIVQREFRHILRIELYTRERNTRNIGFYKSLGFIDEGRQKDKIFKSERELETPIHMAWFNPNYKLR